MEYTFYRIKKVALVSLCVFRESAPRPDIYGKIGNAGVSICCLDDAKKLYSGFDLVHALTSVSMTINGPHLCC
jgi:methylmalonyl-CoA mutase N-terminal domain/subunit